MGSCRMIFSLLVWQVGHLLVCRRSRSVREQRLKHIDTHTHTHPHQRCLSCSYPPSFLVSLLLPVAVGQSPDSAACLSTLALLLCSLARSVSVLLGQMTHTIIARFIKEVQWLDLTFRLCGEAYPRLSGLRGLIGQRDGGPGKKHAIGWRKRKRGQKHDANRLLVYSHKKPDECKIHHIW